MAPATVAEVEPDGRRLRREQNRGAVLDALVDLFARGVYQPSAADIAERAGISPRSLFRYFDDVDDLSRAAVDRHLASAAPLLHAEVPADAPLSERVAGLVENRLRLFEATAPAARAARACAWRNPAIAAQLGATRAHLRRQVRRTFAPELDGHPALLPALDALCSFETWELLRAEHGLSRRRLADALATALTSLLAPGRPVP